MDHVFPIVEALKPAVFTCIPQLQEKLSQRGCAMRFEKQQPGVVAIYVNETVNDYALICITTS